MTIACVNVFAAWSHARCRAIQVQTKVAKVEKPTTREVTVGGPANGKTRTVDVVKAVSSRSVQIQLKSSLR